MNLDTWIDRYHEPPDDEPETCRDCGDTDENCRCDEIDDDAPVRRAKLKRRMRK